MDVVAFLDFLSRNGVGHANRLAMVSQQPLRTVGETKQKLGGTEPTSDAMRTIPMSEPDVPGHNDCRQRRDKPCIVSERSFPRQVFLLYRQMRMMGE